jgi:hypothetical protein
MPTIKRTAEGKVITKDGKPSCSCCGGAVCSNFDLDILLHTLHPDYVLAGYTFADEGELFQAGAATVPGYLVQPKRKRGCLRWLCREVVVTGGVIVSASNTEFGGPTENNKDLWVNICRPLHGDETRSGTFLYVIDFLGWQGGLVSPRYWISADDEYYVTKYFVTKP